MSDFYDDNNNYDNNYYDDNSSYDNGGYSNDPYDNSSYSNDPYDTSSYDTNSYSDSSANNSNASFDTNSSEFGTSYDYKNTPASYDAYKKKAANAKVAPLSKPTAKVLKKANKLALIIVLALSLIISCLSIITPLSVASKSIDRQGVYYNSNNGFSDIDVKAKDNDLLVVFGADKIIDITGDEVQNIGDKDAVYLHKGNAMTIELPSFTNNANAQPARVFDVSKAVEVNNFDYFSVDMENGAGLIKCKAGNSGIFGINATSNNVLVYDIQDNKFIKNNKIVKGKEYYIMIWQDTDKSSYVDSALVSNKLNFSSDISAAESSILERNTTVSDATSYLFKPNYSGNYKVYCSNNNVKVKILDQNGEDIYNRSYSSEIYFKKGVEYEVHLSPNEENKYSDIKNVNFVIARIVDFAENIEISGDREIVYFDNHNYSGKHCVIMGGSNVSANFYNYNLNYDKSIRDNIGTYDVNSSSDIYVEIKGADTFNMFYDNPSSMETGKNSIYDSYRNYNTRSFMPQSTFEYAFSNSLGKLDIDIYDKSGNYIAPKAIYDNKTVFPLEKDTEYTILFKKNNNSSNIDVSVNLYPYIDYVAGSKVSIPTFDDVWVCGFEANWKYNAVFDGNADIYDMSRSTLDKNSFVVETGEILINANNNSGAEFIDCSINIDDARNHNELTKGSYNDVIYGYKPATTGNYNFTFDTTSMSDRIYFYIIGEDGETINYDSSYSQELTLPCYLEQGKQYGIKIHTSLYYANIPFKVTTEFTGTDTIKVMNGDTFSIRGLEAGKYMMKVQGANINLLSSTDFDIVDKTGKDVIYFVADGTTTYNFSIEDYNLLDEIKEFDVVIEEAKVGSINRGYEISSDYNSIYSPLAITNPGHYYMLTYGMADATRSITIKDSSDAEVTMTTDDNGIGFDVVEGETYTINIATEKDVAYNIDILFAREVVDNSHLGEEGLYFMDSVDGMEYTITATGATIGCYEDFEANAFEETQDTATILATSDKTFFYITGTPSSIAIKQTGLANNLENIKVSNGVVDLAFSVDATGAYAIVLSNTNITFNVYDASGNFVDSAVSKNGYKIYNSLTKDAEYTLMLTSTGDNVTDIDICSELVTSNTYIGEARFFIRLSNMTGKYSIVSKGAYMKMYIDDMTTVVKSASGLMTLDTEGITDSIVFVETSSIAESTIEVNPGVSGLTLVNNGVEFTTSDTTYTFVPETSAYYYFKVLESTSNYPYIGLRDENGILQDYNSNSGYDYVSLGSIYLTAGEKYSIVLKNNNSAPTNCTCNLVITRSFSSSTEYTGHNVFQLTTSSSMTTRIATPNDAAAIITVYDNTANANNILGRGVGYVDIAPQTNDVYVEVLSSKDVLSDIDTFKVMGNFNENVYMSGTNVYVYSPTITGEYSLQIDASYTVYTDIYDDVSLSTAMSTNERNYYNLEAGKSYYVEFTCNYSTNANIDFVYNVVDMNKTIAVDKNIKMYLYGENSLGCYTINAPNAYIIYDSSRYTDRYTVINNSSTKPTIKIEPKDARGVNVSFTKMTLGDNKYTISALSDEIKYDLNITESGNRRIYYFGDSSVYINLYEDNVLKDSAYSTGNYIEYAFDSTKTYTIGLDSNSYNYANVTLYVVREFVDNVEFDIDEDSYFYIKDNDGNTHIRITTSGFNNIKVSTSKQISSGYDLASGNGLVEYNGASTSDYYIKVSASLPSTVKYVSTGIGNVTSSIPINNTIKKYKFVPSETGNYRIITAANGNYSDPNLHLYDADGKELAIDDDGASDTFNAMIESALTKDTVYYIGVEDLNGTPSSSETCSLYIARELALGETSIRTGEVFYIPANNSGEKYNMYTNYSSTTMTLYVNDEFSAVVVSNDDEISNISSDADRYIKITGSMPSSQNVNITLMEQNFDKGELIDIAADGSADYRFTAQESGYYVISVRNNDYTVNCSIIDSSMNTISTTSIMSGSYKFRAVKDFTYTIRLYNNSYYRLTYDTYLSKVMTDSINDTISSKTSYYVDAININKIIKTTNGATINVYDNIQDMHNSTGAAKTGVDELILDRTDGLGFITVTPAEGKNTTVTVEQAPFVRYQSRAPIDTMVSLDYHSPVAATRRLVMTENAGSSYNPSVKVYATLADGAKGALMATINKSNMFADIDFGANADYIIELDETSSYTGSYVSIALYEILEDNVPVTITDETWFVVNQLSPDFTVSALGSIQKFNRGGNINDVTSQGSGLYQPTEFKATRYMQVIPNDGVTSVEVKATSGGFNGKIMNGEFAKGNNIVKFVPTATHETIWTYNGDSITSMKLYDADGALVATGTTDGVNMNNSRIDIDSLVVNNTYYIDIELSYSDSFDLYAAIALDAVGTYNLGVDEIFYMPMDPADDAKYVLTVDDTDFTIYSTFTKTTMGAFRNTYANFGMNTRNYICIPTNIPANQEQLVVTLRDNVIENDVFENIVLEYNSSNNAKVVLDYIPTKTTTYHYLMNYNAGNISYELYCDGSRVDYASSIQSDYVDSYTMTAGKTYTFYFTGQSSQLSDIDLYIFERLSQVSTTTVTEDTVFLFKGPHNDENLTATNGATLELYNDVPVNAENLIDSQKESIRVQGRYDGYDIVKVTLSGGNATDLTFTDADFGHTNYVQYSSSETKTFTYTPSALGTYVFTITDYSNYPVVSIYDPEDISTAIATVTNLFPLQKVTLESGKTYTIKVKDNNNNSGHCTLDIFEPINNNEAKTLTDAANYYIEGEDTGIKATVTNGIASIYTYGGLNRGVVTAKGTNVIETFEYDPCYLIKVNPLLDETHTNATINVEKKEHIGARSNIEVNSIGGVYHYTPTVTGRYKFAFHSGYTTTKKVQEGATIKQIDTTADEFTLELEAGKTYNISYRVSSSVCAMDMVIGRIIDPATDTIPTSHHGIYYVEINDLTKAYDISSDKTAVTLGVIELERELVLADKINVADSGFVYVSNPTNVTDATITLEGKDSGVISIYDVNHTPSFTMDENGWYTSTNHTDRSVGYIEFKANRLLKINIDYKVDSESSYDYFYIYKGSNSVLSVSGTNRTGSTEITLGANEIIQFRYSKDGSGYAGTDTAKFKFTAITKCEPLELYSNGAGSYYNFNYNSGTEVYTSSNQNYNSSSSSIKFKALTKCRVVIHYTVDSEYNYDYFYIIKNNSTVRSDAGSNRSGNVTITLYANDILEMKYSKDSSGTGGTSDKATFRFESITEIE